MKKIAIAPMINVTNKYFRYFMRLLTKETTLYTQMIVDRAAINNEKLLEFNQVEHPVVLQLAGNDPFYLSRAVGVANKYGYDQLNLNCGCPSHKAGTAKIGACLMLEPDLVKDLCTAMQKVAKVPVTVKCRIGVDDQDSKEDFFSFVEKLPVQEVVVHARKAFLKGVSPARNRSVPPLLYDYVYELKKKFPQKIVWINGGIVSHEEILHHFRNGVDGVMIGRASYQNPWLFAEVDAIYYGKKNPNLSRKEVIAAYSEFCLQNSERLNKGMLAKPLFGLFHNQTGNAAYRAELARLCQLHKRDNFAVIVEKISDFAEKLNPKVFNKKPG